MSPVNRPMPSAGRDAAVWLPVACALSNGRSWAGHCWLGPLAAVMVLVWPRWSRSPGDIWCCGPHLDERRRRLFLGAEAQEFGRGGIKVVAAATGVHPDTIARGVRELAGEAESDPGLLLQLKAFVDPVTRGDPMSLLVWTTKSTRNLADALTKLGHRVSDRTVARMLADLGFSLQGNTKVLEGKQHADRDAQFRYLHGQVTEHAAAGQPVISVDTKKKELVGTYKNGGKEYRPAKTPEPVNVHDFPDKELGKAIPYGIYDVSANTGWVSVGTDHDTSAFAVQTLRRWWD